MPAQSQCEMDALHGALVPQTWPDPAMDNCPPSISGEWLLSSLITSFLRNEVNGRFLHRWQLLNVKLLHRLRHLQALYDHFGSMDCEDLINRVRYMVVGLDCKVIFIDHLSILVSGLDILDERKAIDKTMTLLRQLTQEVLVR